MISSGYISRSSIAKGEFNEEAWEGIQRAIVYLHSKILQELNVPNPRSRKKGRKGVYTNTSRPGEPPHKRTGWLQRHVGFELDRANMRGRITLSTNAMYGVFLELGTTRMAARPWLMATIRKYWVQIKALTENLTR